MSFKGGTGQISFLSSTLNARVAAMKTKRNVSIKILQKTDHLVSKVLKSTIVLLTELSRSGALLHSLV